MCSINPLTLKWLFENIIFWGFLIAFLRSNRQYDLLEIKDDKFILDGFSYGYQFIRRETLKKCHDLLMLWSKGLCKQCQKRLEKGEIVDERCPNVCAKNFMYETWKISERLIKLVGYITPARINFFLRYREKKYQELIRG